MKIGQRLGTGNTAHVYEWGATEIIKVFHDRQAAVHEATKEARNAKLIDQLFHLRAPRFTGVVEFEGKPALIYEKIVGPTMLRACIEPTFKSVSEHAKVMAQIQHELHQAKMEYSPNLKRELAICISNAHALSAEEKTIVLDKLETLPEGQALCHYDFHPGNIMLSPNGPIIIDWLNALVGNQAADLARTFMLLDAGSLPPQAPRWLGQPNIELYSKIDISRNISSSKACFQARYRNGLHRR